MIHPVYAPRVTGVSDSRSGRKAEGAPHFSFTGNRIVHFLYPCKYPAVLEDRNNEGCQLSDPPARLS